jgi:hypothetical protein
VRNGIKGFLEVYEEESFRIFTTTLLHFQTLIYSFNQELLSSNSRLESLLSIMNKFPNFQSDPLGDNLLQGLDYDRVDLDRSKVLILRDLPHFLLKKDKPAHLSSLSDSSFKYIIHYPQKQFPSIDSTQFDPFRRSGWYVIVRPVLEWGDTIPSHCLSRVNSPNSIVKLLVSYIHRLILTIEYIFVDILLPLELPENRVFHLVDSPSFSKNTFQSLVIKYLALLFVEGYTLQKFPKFHLM